MKKNLTIISLLVLMIVLSVSPLISFASILPPQIRVIFNQTRVFSTSDLNSLDTSEKVSEATIRMATLHEVFNVVDEVNDLYKIQIDDQEGYILKIAVIDNSISSPENILQTNAKTVTNTYVYEKIGDTYYKHEEITLAKDTRIRILDGFDKGKEYTLISYQIDNLTYSYYVKTNFIDPDGIDNSIILAVTLIIACVSAGLIIFRIFKPKKKIIK